MLILVPPARTVSGFFSTATLLSLVGVTSADEAVFSSLVTALLINPSTTTFADKHTDGGARPSSNVRKRKD